MNDPIESASISANDRKAVSAYNTRRAFKKILIICAISCVLPIALLAIFIVLPASGFFAPRRAKASFAISIVWLLSAALVAASIILTVQGYDAQFNINDLGKDISVQGRAEQAALAIDCVYDDELDAFLKSNRVKLENLYADAKEADTAEEKEVVLNEYNEYVDSLADREFTRNVYTYTYEEATYESCGLEFDYGVYVGEQNEPVMFGKLHKATSASDIEDFMDNVYYEWDQKAETYENDLLAYGKDITDAEEHFGDRERHTSAESRVWSI